MTIAELEPGSKARPRVLLVLMALILSVTASFGLGILAGRDLERGRGGSDFSITSLPLTTTDNPGNATTSAYLAGGQVVASRSGTKYFLPWCGGASLISEANKIWFRSAEEAEAHGYAPAANCKGL